MVTLNESNVESFFEAGEAQQTPNNITTSTVAGHPLYPPFQPKGGGFKEGPYFHNTLSVISDVNGNVYDDDSVILT